MIIKLEQLTPKQIDCTELNDNERSKGQRIAYMRGMDEKQVMIQMGFITLNEFGIPRENPDYYPNEKSMAHIKIPLIDGVEKDALLAIDDKFGSDEIKEKLFKSKNVKHVYTPIVRDSEPGKDGKERPQFMKVKLDIEYNKDPSAKIKIITQLFDKDKKKIQAEGNETDKDLQKYTLEEFKQHVKYLSKIKLIITPCKVWAANATKTYGITWKVKQIVVDAPQYTSQLTCDPIFIDDDEDDGKETKITEQSLDTINTNLNQASIDESNKSTSPSEEGDSSDSDDDSSDSEQIQKPQPKKTRGKGKTK